MSEESGIYLSGSFVFNSGGQAAILVAGSGQPRTWTVSTTYYATDINPDLKLQLVIGGQTFLLAPDGPPTSTHTATGTEVSYICEFLSGVNLLVGWTVSSSG